MSNRIMKNGSIPPRTLKFFSEREVGPPNKAQRETAVQSTTPEFCLLDSVVFRRPITIKITYYLTCYDID